MRRAIPTELGLLTKLKELSIYGMQLTGTIPSELGLMASSLTALYLHENYLSGKIPSELGLLTNLSSLWLHVLALTGTVPAELCALNEAGTLKTLAIDCNKVACSCQCSCPTEGGDVPRSNPALAAAQAEPLLVADPAFRDPVMAKSTVPTGGSSGLSGVYSLDDSIGREVNSLSNLFSH
jgi:hypothetical protein